MEIPLPIVNLLLMTPSNRIPLFSIAPRDSLAVANDPRDSPRPLNNGILFPPGESFSFPPSSRFSDIFVRVRFVRT